MRLIQVREIYREIAHDLDIPYRKVKEAIEKGEFKFVAHMMGTQLEKGVRLPYFGRFFPDPVRVRRLLMIKWTKLKKLKENLDKDDSETLTVKRKDLIALVDTGLYLYERNQQLKNRKK
jgi:hypothetical protein